MSAESVPGVPGQRGGGVVVFDGQEFLKFLIALLAIMNPLGAVPVFVTMTGGQSAGERARSALMTALTVLITLAVSAAAGQSILAFFGIDIDDFRVAGGIVVLLMALSMLHAEPSAIHHTPEEASEGAEKDNPAVMPLGVPLLAGPGAIATVILFAQQAGGMPGFAAIAAVILIAAVAVYLALRLGAPLAHALGRTGLNIVTRLMGLIIAAIAVSMIAAGLARLFPGLAHAAGA